MVIGNFALLEGLDPHALHRWDLGIYIDAFEWVEAPNMPGMSPFADGGRLATKPYVSSVDYLSRMGNHCQSCYYKALNKTAPPGLPVQLPLLQIFRSPPQHSRAQSSTGNRLQAVIENVA